MKKQRLNSPKVFGLALLCAIALPVLTSGAADSGNQAQGVSESKARPVSGGRRDVERHFESLTIGSLSYTNVWVHRQTNFNILIRHQGGIDTIKLTDLPQSELDELRPQLGELANIKEEKEPQLVSRFKEIHESEMSEAYQAQMEERLKEIMPMVQALILPAIGVLILLHLVSSFFIFMICKKTQTKAGIEVWLPLVNQTALLRAAGLPGVWALLGFMAPLIPAAVFSAQLLPPASLPGLVVVGISLMFSVASGVVWLTWCFKICIARQKSGWLGILLLIPGVNLVTFTYLAFAD